MSENPIEKPAKTPTERLSALNRMAGAYHLDPNLMGGESVRAKLLSEVEALEPLFVGNDIALAQLKEARAFLTPAENRQAA